MEIRQIWLEDLSTTEQVVLLSCCLLRVSYPNLPTSFSSVLQLLTQWMLQSPSFDSLLQCVCDSLIPQAFKITSSPLGTLNSRQIIQREVQFDGCLAAFCDFITVLCGTKLNIKLFDAALNEYAMKYEKLLRDEGLPIELFQTRFVEITEFSTHPSALKNLTVIRTRLEEIVKEECNRLHSELSQIDCTDDVYSRLLFCGQVWQLIIQLHKSDREMICTFSDTFVSLLMQVDIHSQQGGRIWGYFLQIFLVSNTSLSQPCSALKPLRDFFGLLSDRILASSKLVLFDTPSINEGFRYNLATSIHNSDMVMIFALSVDARVAVKDEVNINDYEVVLSNVKEWIEDMPFRHLMHIALFRLTLSLLDRDDTSSKQAGQTLLQNLSATQDFYGVASSYFFSLLSSSSSLKAAFQSIQQTTLNSIYTSPLICPLCYHSLLQITQQFYLSLDRNTQMRAILFLEKTAMLSGSLSLTKLAAPVLEEIASIENQQSFIQSFTLSLLKKSWKTNQISLQAIFELLQVLSSCLPSLLSIALCCLLQGAQGSLSSSQSLIAGADLAKTQFYSLQDTSFTCSLREVFVSTPLAQRFALSGMLWQLFQQVFICGCK